MTNKFIYSKKPFRRMTALLLSAVILMGLVPVQGSPLFGSQTVKAAEATLSNPTTTEGGVTIWDCVYFGNYVQSDATGATKEPIKWRVLSVDGDDAFLLADENLEMKKYNESYEKVTWETCTLRTWLNGDFLNTAFTAEEQAAIKDTEVVNNNNPIYGTAGGVNTTDKVYLLSIEEAMNTDYGFTSISGNTKTREVKDTAYVASKNGGWGSKNKWWLRSPGYNSFNATCVSASGAVYNIGYNVNDGNPAVRPALHINLNSLSEWEYAGTVDSNGPEKPSDEVKTWDCIYFGNYSQSVGVDPEPIKWRVLSVDGDDAFLLADENLEMKKYNESYENVTWETCTLRTWLNGDFLNTAFTEEEQAVIKDTEVVNSNNPRFGTDGGDNTTDKIYLLSIEEAMNTDYGFTSTVYETKTREVKDTAYVASKNGGYGSRGQWWLRSPGHCSGYTAFVVVGAVFQEGKGVTIEEFGVRPALHIDLESLSEWKYAGTIDSNGNVTEPSITVNGQTGTVTYGTNGSATYEIEDKDFLNSVFAPSVEWNGTIPEGVVPTFNANNTRLTLTVPATTNAGTYRFKVTSGNTESEEATLVIDKADVAAITTAVENISQTAYEAMGHTTKDAVVALANLPSEVAVSLFGGGTATLPITWATDTVYNVKGTTYAVTGTLTGNDNINPGSVTKSVNVEVTTIRATNPTFDELSVQKDTAKSTVDATDLGSDVLPTSGTVAVPIGGGAMEAVNYTIAWSGTLDMTAVGNNTTFTGEVSYPGAPAWLTLPESTTVTRKVTIVDKTPTMLTVSFHANGGDGSMTSVSVPKGSYTLPSCTFSRGGYSFGGWKIGDIGTAYATGASIPVDGDITVYAQWTQSDEAFTAVTNIKGVQGAATVGTDLTLRGTVVPGGATNETIQWTVRSTGTTGATISDGKLKTTGSGIAVITATIKNGKTETTDYTKDFTIKVTYPIKKGSTHTVSGYRYKVTSVTNSKKEVAFVGLTADKKKTATTINIGNTVKIKGITLKVTSVGTSALKGNPKVKTVKLGNNVQTIESIAFHSCKALKSITIGTGLKTMGNHVFWRDTKLKTITIQSTKLTKVGTHDFYHVKATVKVPASRFSSYKRLFKGKQGSLKITK